MYGILLVEDNELNRDMLSRRLRPPDLVLMDLSLPEMDGWQATRQLKGDAGTRGIPVAALTAHAMLGDLEKALEAGCDDYATAARVGPVSGPVLHDGAARETA
jgi:two-component system, cell cycle response regulator DivK